MRSTMGFYLLSLRTFIFLKFCSNQRGKQVFLSRVPKHTLLPLATFIPNAKEMIASAGTFESPQLLIVTICKSLALSALRIFPVSAEYSWRIIVLFSTSHRANADTASAKSKQRCTSGRRVLILICKMPLACFPFLRLACTDKRSCRRHTGPDYLSTR